MNKSTSPLITDVQPITQDTAAGQDTVLKMKDCPKYDHCSAPLCPLDPEWTLRRCLKDEAVCFYLREYAKEPTRALFEGVTPRKLYSAIVEVYAAMMACCAPLRRALARVKKTPSKRVLAGKPSPAAGQAVKRHIEIDHRPLEEHRRRKPLSTGSQQTLSSRTE